MVGIQVCSPLATRLRWSNLAKRQILHILGPRRIPRSPDAIRRLEGVVDARQYTVPKEQYLDEIRNGQTWRWWLQRSPSRVLRSSCLQCDKAKIENEIKTMENYFVGLRNCSSLHFPRGTWSRPQRHSTWWLRSSALVKVQMALVVIEYSFETWFQPWIHRALPSSLTHRGLYRLAKHGGTGCYTVFGHLHQLDFYTIRCGLESTFSIRNIIKTHTSVWVLSLLWYTITRVRHRCLVASAFVSIGKNWRNGLDSPLSGPFSF